MPVRGLIEARPRDSLASYWGHYKLPFRARFAIHAQDCWAAIVALKAFVWLVAFQSNWPRNAGRAVGRRVRMSAIGHIRAVKVSRRQRHSARSHYPLGSGRKAESESKLSRNGQCRDGPKGQRENRWKAPKSFSN